MNKIIFSLLLASTILYSCERCYECTLTDQITGNVDRAEFCGAISEADELEASGYVCSAK